MFFSKITDYFLHGAAAIAIILALAMIFFYAPVEKSMGIVQKIFYFHVGSAITMMVFFLICSVSGILYIIKRKDIFDIAGLASAEIGVLFACIVLVTGPLWA
jgi:heme exporter protein C